MKVIKVKAEYVKAIVTGKGGRAKSIDNYVFTARLVGKVIVDDPYYRTRFHMFVLQMGHSITKFYGVQFSTRNDGEIVLTQTDGMVTLFPLEEVKTYRLAK